MSRHGLIGLLIFILGCIPLTDGWASKGITFEQLLEEATATYPALVAARLDARASLEDVSATERLRWPTISTTIESNSGNVGAYPSRSVQVDQTIWDFGRNTALIAAAQALADAGLLKMQLQQQDVYLQMTASWQNMIAAHERLNVAVQTRDRLKEYRAQMSRRVDAEVSPRIDLELAEARLLQTEVEIELARTSLQVAMTRLEQYSGRVGLINLMGQITYFSSLGETEAFATRLKGIDWRDVAVTHPVVTKARVEAEQALRRLDAKRAEAFPQVFARLYKPIPPAPNILDTSTSAFVGIRYTPGAGFSTLAEAKALATRSDGAQQSVETAVREMQQTLQSDQEEFVNARLRIVTLEKSVSSSAAVLESYQRQFQAGRKQWQDLLNQVRDLAQNQYSLADARASMVAAMYRLQIRMGLMQIAAGGKDHE